MDYKIIEKAAFTVIGKSIQVTTKNGDNLREIPKFWNELNADGTSDQIHALGTGDDILGICLDFKHGEEKFTYLIAAEGSEDVATANGLESRTIPASTWAVFTSIGPMPPRSKRYGKEFFRNGSLPVIMSIQAARNWKCILWAIHMLKTTEVKFGFRLRKSKQRTDCLLQSVLYRTAFTS